jgi:hypothetical protein
MLCVLAQAAQRCCGPATHSCQFRVVLQMQRHSPSYEQFQQQQVAVAGVHQTRVAVALL